MTTTPVQYIKITLCHSLEEMDHLSQNMGLNITVSHSHVTYDRRCYN